ncbi:MAG: ArnT family glycosyltransferase [Anaerolineae bacterium]
MFTELLARLTLPMQDELLNRWRYYLCDSPGALCAALLLIVGLAVLAPLSPIASNRFHHDEAVYSSWALDIASGRDIMVSGSPVDKPPLFLYIQALSFLLFGATETAARLPSLTAHVLSTLFVYRLGHRLYRRSVGLLAAFFWAASPFAILFAATAFTDSMMVMFVLAACLAIVEQRGGWAGISLGLAVMTKQQGILFLPLIVGLGRYHTRDVWKRFALGLAWMVCIVLIWDVARGRRPGFLEQSLLSYGPLSVPLGLAWQRLISFAGWLQYATGSRLLNYGLILGITVLLLGDGSVLFLRHRRPNQMSKMVFRAFYAGDDTEGEGAEANRTLWKAGNAIYHDMVISGFLLIFLVGHALVGFQVWDRYMLGTVPLLLLLLARVIMLPWNALYARGSKLIPKGTIVPKAYPVGNGKTILLSIVYIMLVFGLLFSTLAPIQDAAASRFPIGGDHGAYDGIEQLVAYFKAVPENTTFYHRWLGSHWRFYLWGSPYDFRAWTSPEDLAAQASARPGARRYIVFPSWRSSSEARLALKHHGLALHEVFRTLRRDGSVSFIVYRIEEAK